MKKFILLALLVLSFAVIILFSCSEIDEDRSSTIADAVNIGQSWSVNHDDIGDNWVINDGIKVYRHCVESTKVWIQINIEDPGDPNSVETIGITIDGSLKAVLDSAETTQILAAIEDGLFILVKPDEIKVPNNSQKIFDYQVEKYPFLAGQIYAHNEAVVTIDIIQVDTNTVEFNITCGENDKEVTFTGLYVNDLVLSRTFFMPEEKFILVK